MLLFWATPATLWRAPLALLLLTPPLLLSSCVAVSLKQRDPTTGVDRDRTLYQDPNEIDDEDLEQGEDLYEGSSGMYEVSDQGSTVFVVGSDSPPLSGDDRSLYSEGLLYNHFAKTGGSFIKTLMRAAFSRQQLRVLEEDQGMGPIFKRGHSYWVIGSLRNPCDYYVSMWAYNSCCGGFVSRYSSRLRKFLGNRTHKDDKFGAEEDVNNFRRWVRELSDDTYNYETIRMWVNYYAEAPHPYYDCRRRKLCVDDPEIEYNMTRDMHSESMASLANCWVMTDNLVDDLRACLEQYQAETNNAVNFTRYDELVANTAKNPSMHQHCAHYYDEDTAQFVKERDLLLVKAFDFKTCCARGGLKW